MYGKGRPGPTASGVRTGKICSRKWRAMTLAGAPDSSQVVMRMPSSTRAGRITSDELPGVAAVQRAHAGGDPLEHLGRRQTVRPAGVDPRLELIVHPGDADHEELVEVGDEDGQELQPLDQGDRLVLGQLQHAVVEVQPGQLAVEEQRGVVEGHRLAGAVLGRVQGGLVHAGPDSPPDSLAVPAIASPAIAASSAGRSRVISSPLWMAARPPLRIRAWAPVRSYRVRVKDGS